MDALRRGCSCCNPVIDDEPGGQCPVVAGFDSAYALKSDGTVWAWGNNFNGQLGNGSRTESHVPVRAAGLNRVVNQIIPGRSRSGFCRCAAGSWLPGWLVARPNDQSLRALLDCGEGRGGCCARWIGKKVGGIAEKRRSQGIRTPMMTRRWGNT